MWRTTLRRNARSARKKKRREQSVLSRAHAKVLHALRQLPAKRALNIHPLAGYLSGRPRDTDAKQLLELSLTSCSFSVAPLANGKRSWRQWQQRLGVKTTLSATTATSIHIGDCCRCLPILPLVNRSSIIVSSRSALLPLLYRSSAAVLPLFHHPRGLPSGGSTATSQQQPATVDIRGVYHLRGLPSHPPRNHQPSTSAGSTATSQQ